MANRMLGKRANAVKLRWLPVVAVGLLALAIAGGSWSLRDRVSLSLSPNVNDLNLPEQSNPTLTQPAVPAATPSVRTSPAESSLPKPTASTIAARLGVLRISNLSDHPVRIALLPKQPVRPKTVTNKPSYDIPAHWDFAPQEGSTKGLIVSLPDRSIRIKPGDVLVAFAEDGSRRYWGPYVVGETELPTWSSKSGEWQLRIQP